MAGEALILEQVREAERDARSYLCDVCHAAKGLRFFDQFWVCDLCAQAVLLRLRDEQRRLSPAFWEGR
jgi:hypothetical protein